MKKNKLIIKIVFIILILTLIMGIVGYMLFYSSKDKKEIVPVIEDIQMIDQPQEKPDATLDLSGFKVDLMDSKLFELEDLNFRFVIAKIRISDDKPLNLELSHFKTNEGIVLNNVDRYIEQLAEKSYFLGKLNVFNKIISVNNEAMFNIFIPIINPDAKSIELISDLVDDDLKIELKDPSNDSSLLSYQSDDIITDGETFQMVVSKAINITGDELYEVKNDEKIPYTIASTLAIYAYEVEVVSLWGDTIYIEDAKYYPDDSSDVLSCLDGSIQSLKYSNIINRSIIEKSTGSIFFTAYNPNQEAQISYHGELKIKIKGNDNPIVVKVDLN